MTYNRKNFKFAIPISLVQHWDQTIQRRFRNGSVNSLVLGVKLPIVRLVAVGIGVIALAHLISESDTVYPGVTVNGVSVAGMSRGSLEKYIQQLASPATHTVTVELKAQVDDGLGAPTSSLTSVRLRPTDFTINSSKTIARCWLRGREVSLSKRLASRASALFGKTYDVAIVTTVSEPVVLRAAKALARPPKNAAFVENGSGWRVIPGQLGLHVSPESARAALMAALTDGSPGGARAASVIADPIAPVRSQSDLESLRFRLAECSTPIVTRSASAKKNMALLASLMNGTLLAKGETYSVNTTVGRRTAADGFESAPVLLKGVSKAEAIGGGICQCSTTVFQSVALAGLTIVERHAHSKPSRYTRPGWDSTLDYPTRKDLAFTNPGTCGRVALHVWASGGRMHAEVLGERPLPKPIRLSDEVTLSPEGNQLKVILIRTIGSNSEVIARSAYAIKPNITTKRKIN